MTNSAVTLFWQAYLGTLPANHVHRLQPLPEAWSFGDSPDMADSLGKLVVSGTKTATCCRYGGENIIDSGGLSIILDGNETPLCLIDTFEVTVRPYREVDANFAADEGEGDRSLEYWREAHWAFFSREAQTEGYDVHEDMLLACERFRVLYLHET